MPQLSEPASHLLNLLAALGEEKIPNLLFERFWRPQWRWNEDGDSVSTSFDADSANLLGGLLEPECFGNLVNELVSSSWIRVNQCDEGSETSYLMTKAAHERVTQLLGMEGAHSWTILALKLVCHVFPRDPILDEG